MRKISLQRQEKWKQELYENAKIEETCMFYF